MGCRLLRESNMLTKVQTCLALSLCLAAGPALAEADLAFRPPAVPLVTSDPFLSVWSDANRLTDDVTRHWTHHPHPLVSLIRVDGVAARLMGNDPTNIPALPQTGLTVTPTRSIYEFEDAKVHVTLTFMTPALPHDLDVFSRPVTYLTWTVRSVDGSAHSVAIYDSVSGLLTVNKSNEKVTWAREKAGSLSAMGIGTAGQPVLGSGGDDHRIDWGYAYLAGPKKAQSALGANSDLLNSFAQFGSLPAQDDNQMPRPADSREPVMAFVFDMGMVANKPVSRHVLVAYDEIYAIKYFGQDLRPYWRRNGEDAAGLLKSAEKDYKRLTERCQALCEDCGAGLSRMRGGLRPGGGPQQTAFILYKGKHQQRRHRHGGRFLSDGSDLGVVEPDSHQGNPGAHSELRGVVALEVSQRAS